jgi:hypothetical protein
MVIDRKLKKDIRAIELVLCSGLSIDKLNCSNIHRMLDKNKCNFILKDTLLPDYCNIIYKEIIYPLYLYKEHSKKFLTKGYFGQNFGLSKEEAQKIVKLGQNISLKLG